jgi:cyclopropane fatty-acyl-phospholipid synthase-like methyltransferase
LRVELVPGLDVVEVSCGWGRDLSRAIADAGAAANEEYEKEYVK